MTMRHLIALLVSASSCAIHHAGAQNATIYYKHNAGPDTAANPRLTYLAAGERTGASASDRHRGQPPMLAVPRGSKACVVVESPNLLLYDYTIESKTLTIASPEGLASILEGLKTIAIAALGAEKATVARGVRVPPFDKYGDEINRVIGAGKKLETLKQNSDADSINFAAAAAAMATANSANANADSLFNIDSTDATFKLLHSVQVSAYATVSTQYKEFTDAQAVGSPEYCVVVKDSPLHVTLSAKRKAKSDKTPRPVGELFGADAEPINEKSFDVMPVAMATFLVGGARNFYLDEQQKLRDKSDPSGYFPSVGALASYRLGGYVWAGAALAKGQSGDPDTFIGLVFRNASTAQSFVLGVGAGFASVPTDLSNGAALNSPLPANTELSKVIKRSRQVGLAIVFSVTGLNLTK